MTSLRRVLISLLGLLTVFSVACGDKELNQDEQVTSPSERQLQHRNELRTQSEEQSSSPPAGQHSDVLASANPGFDSAEGTFRATLPTLGDIEIDPTGTLQVEPPTAIDTRGNLRKPSWKYSLGLESIGRSSAHQQFNSPEPTEMTSSGVRTSFGDGSAVLRYERTSVGLEQLIDLNDKPDGDGKLVVRFRSNEQFRHLKTDGNRVRVTHKSAGPVLSWKKLHVFDASGKSLDAEMVSDDNVLEYRIDDSNAEYPVTVDPLISVGSASDPAERESSSAYGRSVSIEADIDGNGYSDLIIGQSSYGQPSGNTPLNRGRILVYLSDSSGLSNQANVIVEGSQASEAFGISITSVGNLTPSGGGSPDPDDFGVGAWKHDSEPTNSSTNNFGRVAVFEGNAQLSKSSTQQQNAQTLGMPIWTKKGASSGDYLGLEIDSGDFDCDGTPDIAISAPPANGFSGRVEVYYGNTSSPYFSTTSDWSFVGPQSAEFLGGDLAAANFDGDSQMGNGCDDLVIGSNLWDDPSLSGQNHGRVRMFRGSSSGLSSTEDWLEDGTDNEGNFGISLSAVGDTTSDGFPDLGVGAFQETVTGVQKGRAYIYRGKSSAPGLEDNPSWSKDGFQQNERFGIELVGGDLNGDSYADIVVGAEQWSSTGNREEGRAYAFLGTPTGPQKTAQWTSNGGKQSALYGAHISSKGDLNNDGVDDLVVTAQTFSTGSTPSAGEAFVYHGQLTCRINSDFFVIDSQNPGNECEACKPGTSITSWSIDTAKNGQSCTASNQCLSNTTCQNGTCTGPMKNCDDGNACTQDSCDPAQGCINDGAPLDGSSCPDDGLSCTSDTCQGGSCTHQVTTGCAINGSCYAAGDPHPTDECRECRPSVSTTTWSMSPAGTSCDDGAFCNVGETCNSSGSCTGGSPRDCEAEVDTCADDVSCNESVDTCNPIDPAPNGTSCDDGNACTTNDTCQSGFCGGTSITCSNPCKSCNPDTGMCTENRPDGVSCDNDDACTNATCQTGTCTTQGSVDCDDMNPCTADSCDSNTGCQNADVPDGTEIGTPSCNDNFNLLQSATCQGGEPQDPTIQDCGNYKCSSDPNPNCPTVCTEDADCKDGNFCVDDPSDSDGDQECLGNRPPTADAGPDQGGYSKNERVRLDGTQSSDPDNDMLSYTWSLVDANCPQAGESADLAGLQQAINDQNQWDPTAANPQFSAPAPDCENEELTFELEVSDGTYTVTDDTVISYGTCNNPPNAVVAGQPATAEWGSSVTLDASNSQTGCGSSLEYSWSYMPQEPELTTSGSESLSVTLPDICREESTTYTFNLTVFDGVQNSDPYDRDLFVPANGPCDDGGDVSGSGGCSSTGNGGGPIGGLAAMLFAGGLAVLRRRRRN